MNSLSVTHFQCHPFLLHSGKSAMLEECTLILIPQGHTRTPECLALLSLGLFCRLQGSGSHSLQKKDLAGLM